MRQALRSPFNSQPSALPRITAGRRTSLITRVTGTFLSTSACVIFVLAIGYPDPLSGTLFIASLALLFDILFISIASHRIAILTLCFAFYHIFLFILPGLIHITRNRFPFYGLSYGLHEFRLASFLLLIFTASIYVGIFISLYYSRKSRAIKLGIQINRVYSIRMLIFVSFVLMFIAIYCGYWTGFDFFSARRAGDGGALIDKALVSNQIIINLARFCSFVACMCIWQLFRARKSNLLLILALLFSLIAIFFNQPQSIPRFYLFGYILTIVYLMVDLSIPSRKMVLFFVMISSLFIVFPLASIIARGDVTNIDRFNPIEYYQNNGDFDGMQSTLNVIHFVDQRGSQDGKQLMGSVFTFVPRSIWTNKPTPTGELSAQNIGYRYLNISAPLASEIYIDFRFWGVAIFGLLFGYALIWADLKAQANRRGNDILLSLLLGMTIGFEIIVLRGSLMPALSPVALIMGLTILARTTSSQTRRVRRRSADRQPRYFSHQ